MKNVKFIIIGSVLTILIIVLLYFILVSLGFSRYGYIAIAIPLLGFGVYGSIYYQKLQKPHCDTCGHILKFVNREKIDQQEEIRNGKFVFINTYKYHYRCQHCKEDSERIKSIKLK